MSSPGWTKRHFMRSPGFAKIRTVQMPVHGSLCPAMGDTEYGFSALTRQFNREVNAGARRGIDERHGFGGTRMRIASLPAWRKRQVVLFCRLVIAVNGTRKYESGPGNYVGSPCVVAANPFASGIQMDEPMVRACLRTENRPGYIHALCMGTQSRC